MAELDSTHAHGIGVLEPEANNFERRYGRGISLAWPAEIDSVVSDVGHAPQRQLAKFNSRSTND